MWFGQQLVVCKTLYLGMIPSFVLRDLHILEIQYVVLGMEHGLAVFKTCNLLARMDLTRNSSYVHFSNHSWGHLTGFLPTQL